MEGGGGIIALRNACNSTALPRLFPPPLPTFISPLTPRHDDDGDVMPARSRYICFFTLGNTPIFRLSVTYFNFFSPFSATKISAYQDDDGLGSSDDETLGSTTSSHSGSSAGGDAASSSSSGAVCSAEGNEDDDGSSGSGGSTAFESDSSPNSGRRNRGHLRRKVIRPDRSAIEQLLAFDEVRERKRNNYMRFVTFPDEALFSPFSRSL